LVIYIYYIILIIINCIIILQINGPLICFQDINTKQSNCDDYTINGAKEVRFIIQRPFFDDSTSKVSSRAVNEYNTFVDNLVKNIPLINNLEHELFDSLGSAVMDNDDEESVESDIGDDDI